MYFLFIRKRLPYFQINKYGLPLIDPSTANLYLRALRVHDSAHLSDSGFKRGVDMHTTREYPLPRLIVFSLFFSGMAIAAVLASKIILIAGSAVPAGVLAYAITFACSDIVGEVYGERTARKMVLSGFVGMIAVIGLIQLAIAWPAAPFWDKQESYEMVLGSSPRIIIASLFAYLCSQTLDISIFSKLRKATDGKHLWLRNNASTFCSQLIDSAIFVTIAFYDVFPVTDMIIGQWVVKMIIAAIDTPIVYLGVSMLRPAEEKLQKQPAFA